MWNAIYLQIIDQNKNNVLASMFNFASSLFETSKFDVSIIT